MLGNKGKCQPIVNMMRGFFDFEFCNLRSEDLRIKDDKYSLILGNAELLIPDLDRNGYYFSAPTLIHHYITVHNYIPPHKFLDSLVHFDLENEFRGNDLFKYLVEKHGGIYFH